MTAASKISAALGCTCQKPDAATWKENGPTCSCTHEDPASTRPSASTLIPSEAWMTLSDCAPAPSSQSCAGDGPGTAIRQPSGGSGTTSCDLRPRSPTWLPRVAYLILVLHPVVGWTASTRPSQAIPASRDSCSATMAVLRSNWSSWLACCQSRSGMAAQPGLGRA